jgi:hypothetical protein
MMPTLRRTLHPVSLLAAGVLISGCGSTTETPADDHDPASYTLLVGGTELSQPYTIPANQTTRIRVKFYNAANEDLDVVEGEHFGGLEFSPATLASANRLADHHFQFDVVAGDAGTGTRTVRFGHDEGTDEVIFDPVAFKVE